MAARPIATATISFGLVSIPVQALHDQRESGGAISFNMLHSCGSRVKQQYWCPKDERVVPRDELVKGYEFAKGQYVTFTRRGAEGARGGRLGDDRHHRVRAGRAGRSALLREGLLPRPRQGRRQALPAARRGDAQDRSARAIASYAARGKQYLVLIRPFEDGLMLQQLRYADEIKSVRRGRARRRAT